MGCIIQDLKWISLGIRALVSGVPHSLKLRPCIPDKARYHPLGRGSNSSRKICEQSEGPSTSFRHSQIMRLASSSTLYSARVKVGELLLALMLPISNTALSPTWFVVSSYSRTFVSKFRYQNVTHALFEIIPMLLLVAGEFTRRQFT